MLIRKLADDNYQLITAGGVKAGSLPELKEFIAGESVMLILPANLCTSKQVTYAEHEKKLLHKVIPFTLEEDLADRVDDLHFVINKLPEHVTGVSNRALVSFVDKLVLSSELEHFRQQLISVQSCIPEQCLLPCSPGQWTIIFPDSSHCIIRTEFGESISSSLPNLSLVLETLVREKPVAEKISVYLPSTDSASVKQQVGEKMSATFKNKVEFIDQDYMRLLLQGSLLFEKNQQQKSGTMVNLLSGEFSPQLPWGSWWKQWQLVAMLVIALGLVDTAVRVAETYRLSNLNQLLDEETRDIFRQVIPEGAIVDPRVQLQRRLESLQGNNGSGFIAILDRAAPVIMNNPALEVQNINYSERDREIQMTLITSDFNTAESIRASLQSLGLQAELIGSTSSAEGNRSRLRIGS